MTPPSPLISFLLRSLNYPQAACNPDDPAQLQAAVVWLENTRIRAYPIDGRAQLQSGDPAAWSAALRKYLTDLECPLHLETAGHRAVLQWLLTHAVGLEYTDTAQQLNAAAQRAETIAGRPEEWSEGVPPPLPDATSEGVRSALVELKRALHVDGGGSGAAEGPAEGLQRAHAMLEACVLPALAEQARRQRAAQPAAPGAAPQQAQQAAAAAMLAQYPLGFSTGDGATDLAATVLRMLYIKDLRALQTMVDAAIVAVQEYTANPRTDASLGKVGR